VSKPAGYDTSASAVHSDDQTAPASSTGDGTGITTGTETGTETGERFTGSRDLADHRSKDEPEGKPQREVGTKRRRLEAYRQRPDLRVINGEGTGTGRTRSGRLRAVPRETTGGIN
jgi:hypothetical protein